MGQNLVPQKYDFLIYDRKIVHFWTKPISKILTTSLESLYYQEFSIDSDNGSISTIYIVVGGDYDQGKFRSVSNLFLETYI